MPLPGIGESASKSTQLVIHKRPQTKWALPQGCSCQVNWVISELIIQVRIKNQTGNHNAFYNLILKATLHHLYCVLLVIQTNASAVQEENT